MPNKNTSTSYSVYMHKNLINDKVYIGTTSYNPPYKRWHKGASGYKTNKEFYADIEKYGWDKFEHEILANNLSAAEARIAEKEYIERYESINPDKGYNKMSGGLPINELERRKKVSRANELHHNYGKSQLDEVKEKIRKSLSGENGYWYGQKMPSFVGEKISKKMQGNTNWVKHIEEQKTKIQCVETDEVFDSLMQAEREKDVHHSAISLVINGKRNTAGGFHWIKI